MTKTAGLAKGQILETIESATQSEYLYETGKLRIWFSMASTEVDGTSSVLNHDREGQEDGGDVEKDRT